MVKNSFKIFLFSFEFATFVALVIFVSSTVLAQKTKSAPPVTALQKKPSLMWKATNGKNTAYLLGSVHLGTKDFYPLPKEIEDAFEQSSVLLVEFDINKVDAATSQALILKNGVYAGDDNLWNHLSGSTAEQVKKVSAAYNLPVQGLAKLKPWLVALTISVMELQKQGMDAAFGVDKYFLDKAKDKRKIQSLESAEWQMELFSALPDNQQEEYLKSTLDGLGNSKTLADLLQTAWLNGDAKKLATLFDETPLKPAELQKKLLDDRNPKMADAAEQCLKGAEKCFMVVGAAHLIGSKGVVQLLKNRGYIISQVAVTSPAQIK